MELTRLKIMLPYLNDEFKVGESIKHCDVFARGKEGDSYQS